MMELAAERALKGDCGAERDFYEAKSKTAHFYFERMLPRARSLATTMLSPPATVMSMKEPMFCPHGAD